MSATELFQTISCSSSTGKGGFSSMTDDLGPFGTATRAFNTVYGPASAATLVEAVFRIPDSENPAIRAVVTPPGGIDRNVSRLLPVVTTGNTYYSMVFFVPKGYTYSIDYFPGANPVIDGWFEVT